MNGLGYDKLFTISIKKEDEMSTEGTKGVRGEPVRSSLSTDQNISVSDI